VNELTLLAIVILAGVLIMQTTLLPIAALCHNETGRLPRKGKIHYAPHRV
jgi:hypothetical protein